MTLLKAAELFDSWRIVPRIALGAFGWLFGYILLHAWWWYAALPSAERTSNVTAFVGVITTTLSGVAGFVFKIYTENGRDWNEHNQQRNDNAGVS